MNNKFFSFVEKNMIAEIAYINCILGIPYVTNRLKDVIVNMIYFLVMQFKCTLFIS